jgi:hypothetical protein
MKKLTLSLDALEVQSFATADGAPGRGTVRGEQCTCPTNCTCPGCPTCGETCPATCENTCDDDTCNTCAISCYDTCGKTCQTMRCPCAFTDFC